MPVNRTPVPDDVIDLMTDPQRALLLRLIDQREMSKQSRADAIAKIKIGLTKEEASSWISRAQKLPYKNSEFSDRKSEMPIVPPGRYALGDDNDSNDPVRFYEISIGAADNPRWAGFVFLSVFASDETHPIKDFTKKQTIMTLIAADPVAASARYGLLTRRCGVCGRKLTKKESRDRGIGPVCAERQGW